MFSKLDAKYDFLQIKLNEKSSYLTTFDTPLGRYGSLRLPFGIKSVPEIFQRIMEQMLEGIEGAAALMDGIFIGGRNVEHHDQIFRKVIKRATEFNLKLSYDKCEIRQPQVSYVGHLITENGIRPDPNKTRALVDMPKPKDKEGVRRFLRLIHFLAKFIPNLSQVDAPLRGLIKSDTNFVWHHEQENCFNALKRLCCRKPVLAFYDVNKPVEIQCDASKDGLGSSPDSRWMSSCILIPFTDKHRETVRTDRERDAVNCPSASKFHSYIFGKETIVYNDHKPLEMIFKKPLVSTPMRLQKNLKVYYRKRKDMAVADALSRE